jgi:hypothetical protein
MFLKFCSVATGLVQNAETQKCESNFGEVPMVRQVTEILGYPFDEEMKSRFTHDHKHIP